MTLRAARKRGPNPGSTQHVDHGVSMNLAASWGGKRVVFFSITEFKTFRQTFRQFGERIFEQNSPSWKSFRLLPWRNWDRQRYLVSCNNYIGRCSFQIGRSGDCHYYIKHLEISRQIGRLGISVGSNVRYPPYFRTRKCHYKCGNCVLFHTLY